MLQSLKALFFLHQLKFFSASHRTFWRAAESKQIEEARLRGDADVRDSGSEPGQVGHWCEVHTYKKIFPTPI